MSNNKEFLRLISIGLPILHFVLMFVAPVSIKMFFLYSGQRAAAVAGIVFSYISTLTLQTRQFVHTPKNALPALYSQMLSFERGVVGSSSPCVCFVSFVGRCSFEMNNFDVSSLSLHEMGYWR